MEDNKISNEDKKTTDNIINDKDKKDDECGKNMIFKEGGRTYYTTRIEAEDTRRKGDRIYYDPYWRAYYIVRPKKRSFWGF